MKNYLIMLLTVYVTILICEILYRTYSEGYLAALQDIQRISHPLPSAKIIRLKPKTPPDAA